MRAVCLLIALCGLAGCAHRVAIESDPPGARVFLNNVELGMTPLSFPEPGGGHASFELRLEKAGYEPKSALLMPAEPGGACFLAGPWHAKLPDRLYFQLYPAAATGPMGSQGVP